ncbi:MAG: hypothetical protein AB7K09_20955 [Planctomycetota bacterium]
MSSSRRQRPLAAPAVVLLALLLLLPAVVAEAGVVRRASLEGLTNESGCVVRGRIIASEARWEGGLIYTRHQLRVTTCLKGTAKGGDVVIISTLGGQIGDTGQVCCGEASFRAAEDVYCFLRKDGVGRWRVVGMNQGRFSVLTPPPPPPPPVPPATDGDPGTGTNSGTNSAPAAVAPAAEPVVRNSYAGLVVVDAAGNKTDPDPIDLTLSTFEAQVRAAVAAHNGGGK